MVRRGTTSAEVEVSATTLVHRRHRGAHRLFTLVALSASLAGCTVLHSCVAHEGTAPLGVDPHRRAAQHDAAALLASFAPPPGAVPLATGPTDTWIDRPPSRPLTSELIDLTKWWRTPGDMVEVIAWAKSHRQIHWADVGTGAEGQNPPGAEPTSPPSIAVVHERDVTFSLPTRGRAFQSRQVLVSVSPSGKHEVTLRVDAQVVWIPTRETWSYVPRAVSFATATWNGAGRTSTTIATSWNRSEVAKLPADS